MFPFPQCDQHMLIILFHFDDRVSKRCYRLLTNPQSWTRVDFWQEQLLTNVTRSCTLGASDPKTKTWIFPRNQDSVLAFLKRFTSGSLKSIYLNVVSESIVQYLRVNCPNLGTISFFSGSKPPFSTLATRPIGNIGLLSKFSDICFWPDLAKFTKLRRLTLSDVILSSEYTAALSNLQETRDLSLLRITVPSHIRGCDEQSSAALASLLRLQKLRAFRLSAVEPAVYEKWFNIDKFLSSIGGWQNLQALVLEGIEPPSCDTFTLMTSTMQHLKTIKLLGGIITDENIYLIAKHLKNLTSVEFTDGNYSPQGIRILSGHPSIEKLSLLEFRHQPSLQWLLAVYHVLLSLPKIKHVRLIGYEISKTLFFAKNLQNGIPPMPEHLHIDVRNYPFEDMVW